MALRDGLLLLRARECPVPLPPHGVRDPLLRQQSVPGTAEHLLPLLTAVRGEAGAR